MDIHGTESKLDLESLIFSPYSGYLNWEGPEADTLKNLKYQKTAKSFILWLTIYVEFTLYFIFVI